MAAPNCTANYTAADGLDSHLYALPSPAAVSDCGRGFDGNTRPDHTDGQDVRSMGNGTSCAVTRPALPSKEQLSAMSA